MSHMIDIIQCVCVIILFAVVILEYIGLRRKDAEIKALNSELDTLRFNISKDEIKITEDILQSNSAILPVLTKIQRSYAVSKSDKIKLLSFLVVLLRNTDSALLNKVNVANKYTYKAATENIIQYIKNPLYTEHQLVKVLNSVYYLITK